MTKPLSLRQVQAVWASALAFAVVYIAFGGFSRAAPTAKSARIEALMKEVNTAKDKAGEHRRIRFVTSADTGTLEGSVSYYPSEIIVTIPPPSGSRNYDDAIKAHELFHIVLNSRGFAGVGFSAAPGAAALFPLDMRQSAMQAGGVLNQVAISLNSCFPDELIDRETTKRGFQSQLVPAKEMYGKIEDLKTLRGNYESVPDVMKRGQALADFCLLRRLPDTAKLKYETATELVMGPSIVAYRQKLIEHFQGKRCKFSDPEDCHQLTLELREASGFKDVIHLRTPKSGKVE